MLFAPAYAGIRPKISGPDDPAMDFRIDGAETHGKPGLVNLFGIESPGRQLRWQSPRKSQDGLKPDRAVNQPKREMCVSHDPGSTLPA